MKISNHTISNTKFIRWKNKFICPTIIIHLSVPLEDTELSIARIDVVPTAQIRLLFSNTIIN